MARGPSDPLTLTSQLDLWKRLAPPRADLKRHEVAQAHSGASSTDMVTRVWVGARDQGTQARAYDGFGSRSRLTPSKIAFTSAPRRSARLVR